MAKESQVTGSITQKHTRSRCLWSLFNVWWGLVVQKSCLILLFGSCRCNFRCQYAPEWLIICVGVVLVRFLSRTKHRQQDSWSWMSNHLCWSCSSWFLSRRKCHQLEMHIQRLLMNYAYAAHWLDRLPAQMGTFFYHPLHKKWSSNFSSPKTGTVKPREASTDFDSIDENL